MSRTGIGSGRLQPLPKNHFNKFAYVFGFNATECIFWVESVSAVVVVADLFYIDYKKVSLQNTNVNRWNIYR